MLQYAVSAIIVSGSRGKRWFRDALATEGGLVPGVGLDRPSLSQFLGVLVTQRCASAVSVLKANFPAIYRDFVS